MSTPQVGDIIALRPEKVIKKTPYSITPITIIIDKSKFVCGHQVGTNYTTWFSYDGGIHICPNCANLYKKAVYEFLNKK